MTVTTTAPATPLAADKTSVRALLRSSSPDREAIAARFEALDLRGQIEEMRALGAKLQAKLFALSAENRPIEVLELVGEGPAGATWIWEGVNSLPVFRRFQKRVVKATEETLAGYNEQVLKGVTGPGCFTVRACRAEEPGSIVFDYTIPPTVTPKGCAQVRPADQGVSRLVYGNMLDYMHRVSRDVLIGRAYKHGKETANYFLLARGPMA